ncbi:MAG: hypothetical protein KDC35_18955 [Acidobacteria bacterium]|nr:hypothetical protein [Acidobacteriota bacterium]
MKKIADALVEIIEANASLRFGFHYQILNLTQTAHFLKPLVEARTMKEVGISALVMALSRYQKQRATALSADRFQIDQIRVHHNLVSFTWPKSEQIHRLVGTCFKIVEAEAGFLTLSEGMNEITLITERRFVEPIQETMDLPATVASHQMAGIGVKFSKRYLNQPGLLHLILQQVAFQGINVLEVASTATEFVVYVHEEDAPLTFDSIYQRFCTRD